MHRNMANRVLEHQTIGTEDPEIGLQDQVEDKAPLTPPTLTSASHKSAKPERIPGTFHCVG
jgi:hypothetical protein